MSQFSRVKQEQEAPQIKEEILAVKRELKPDHGENFVPGSEAAPTGAAPQALDHFKRGYKERAYLRERETQELSVDFEASAPVKSEDDAVEGEAASADNVQPQLPEKQPESYRFQPPVQIQQPPQRQRGPPPQHPSGSGYRGTYRGPSSFDAVRVIDILCQPGCNIFEVLDQAQFDFSNNFQSGKALTAILSNLARRRKLGIALTVWQWMDQRRIEKNVFHYNSLISVCEKVKDNQRALHLLEEMDRKGIEKNEVTFSSAISACEKSGEWRLALSLLDRMKREGVGRTAIAYNAAISACEKGLVPHKALELFEQMKREGVTPTVITYSALISAAEKGQQWKLALQVLEEMKASGHGANVIAYSAAISALSKGQQWEKALELFREIENSGQTPSIVTYNATMTALEKGLQWEQALDLFDEMKAKRLPITVVSYGSVISACEKGLQYRQCLEYLDEMTQLGIKKNVIIFGAAMSCMEKCCRADIAFQLMSRMKEEGVSPNVHIYNSAISACARCNLWEKGLELFEEMDTVGVERDVVSFNAVLDAVSPQVQLGRRLFELGIEKGFYARVSRLGEQWLELDLHFLSLGGGEIALGWWFEECLVPYLVNTSKLAAVKSIDIVTGYGKTRMRGVRHGDDGMRKRVRAMLHYMNIQEIEQSNKGRIHIDKEALIAEVQKNGGRIIFDEEGYNRYKEENTTANHVPDVPQKLRPRLDLTEPYPLPDPLVDRRSSGPRDGYDRRVSNASRRGSSDIDYGRRSSNNYRNQDERYSSGHRGSGYGNRGGDYNRQGSYDDAFKNHSNYEVDSRALSTVFSNSRGSFNRRSNPQVNDQYQVQVHYDSASNGRVQELYENPREDYYSESRSSNPQYENQYLNRRASDTTDYRGRQGRSNQYEEDRGQYRRRGTYGGRETTTQPYGSHPDQRVDAHVASYQHPQYERQSYGDQDQGEGRYRPLKSSNQEIDSYNGDVGSYGRDSDRGEKRPATSVGGEQPPPAKRRGYDIDSTRSSITGARGF